METYQNPFSSRALVPFGTVAETISPGSDWIEVGGTRKHVMTYLAEFLFPPQRAGAPIEEIRPGDVVWIPPGEKHWHGATPSTAMTHIAIQEQLDGKTADWLEHVTDEQYRG